MTTILSFPRTKCLFFIVEILWFQGAFATISIVSSATSSSFPAGADTIASKRPRIAPGWASGPPGLHLRHSTLSTQSTRRRIQKSHHWNQISIHHGNSCFRSRTESISLQMVRNVDLPETLVFYGLESMFEPQFIAPPVPSEQNSHSESTLGTRYEFKLRSGIRRLLDECKEVGTAALLLCEVGGTSVDEIQLKNCFQQVWNDGNEKNSAKNGGAKGVDLDSLIEGEAPTLSVRCLNSNFASSILSNEGDLQDASDESDEESYIFYNLKSNGRSPSPAFLLDSLHSIKIDPRGFGGSSGFGRGQWVEPRRSPMPARSVVVIAGDWKWSWNEAAMKDETLDTLFGGFRWIVENQNREYDPPTVKDRCAAARASGCRILYLEHIPNDNPNQTNADGGILSLEIQDDNTAINLSDAILPSLGNDNPRDINPISLDAISTPGDFWLNPPCPRDDAGNAVRAEEVVEWFCGERKREMGEEEIIVRVDDGVVDGRSGREEEMGLSDDEMDLILADLDSL